jgi:hypothetical protein
MSMLAYQMNKIHLRSRTHLKLKILAAQRMELRKRGCTCRAPQSAAKIIREGSDAA